jgi:hypothetical protein
LLKFAQSSVLIVIARRINAPPIVGVPAFGKWLGTHLANLLTDALQLQSLYQVRAERKRQHERRERAQDRARRQICEDVEARVELREVIGDVDQH